MSTLATSYKNEIEIIAIDEIIDVQFPMEHGQQMQSMNSRIKEKSLQGFALHGEIKLIPIKYPGQNISENWFKIVQFMKKEHAVMVSKEL